MLRFVWDPQKAKINRKKHNVTFQEAATVFGDPFSVTYPDPDHSIDEERFITMGLSEFGILLVIAHKEGTEMIRIISARKATKFERKNYEEK